MRRLALTLLCLLAFPATALAADVPVDINASAPIYSPQKVTISPGDSVTWTHQNDPVLSPHGVRFDDEAPATPTCSQLGLTGSTCSRTFPSAGRFAYFDPATCSDPPASACAVNGLVVVYVPPTASFTSSTAAQSRGQAINFDASGSQSPGGSITAYSWDFGDGSTSAGATASHAYATAGTYTVKLSVTDDQGGVATAQQDVTITVPDSDGDGINDDLDKCPNNAGPAPDGCPLTPYVLPGPIATSSVAAGELDVVGALRYGIPVAFTCSDTCTGAFTLTRNGKPVLLPRTVALAHAGSQLVTLKFTSSAKRSLAKLKNPRLLLTTTVTDALQRKQTSKRWVTLQKLKTFGRLPAIGISDNNQGTFDDPNFQVLRLHYARLVSPWNAIFTERARLDAWLQSARAHGIRPLVSFEHTRGQQCPGRRCKGPSVSQYTKAWKAFHKKYPWVKDISPWNEANSATQPTGARPELAAAYYNVVRANCRGCTIVAADLLDSPNISRYAYAFLAKAKGRPRLWGLHNYTDTNRFRARGTKALLQTVHGTVWLTETGGVVKFVTQSGKVALPKSESRAKKAMDYMFRLAEQNASRIKRIYVYQWKVNNVFDRFDAGVVRPDGTPRPSFQVLSLNASIAARR